MCRSLSSSLHSAPPDPPHPAGLCGHLADGGAENCVGLWAAGGVCFHGYGDSSSTSQHEAARRAHFGSQSTGEDELVIVLKINLIG